MRKSITLIASLFALVISGAIYAYNPEGKEEFVFIEKAEPLQKFGYDNFCPDTKSFACMKRLSYAKYVGKRGYFVSDSPQHSDSFGYDFYKVVLESDEEYFYVANKKRGKYGTIAPIIPYAQYLELKSFNPEALFSGSSVELTAVSQDYGIRSYTLSNGKSVRDKDLKLIREVATKFGGKASLAELLLEADIEKDDVDDKYFIQPRGNILRSEAKLYIGAGEGKVWLRFKVKYYDDDWLFVDSYKVAADEYRWQSPKQKFQRDNASGSVWEWVDVSAGPKEIEIATALSSAANATIRFQGSQYYSDKKLEDDQKQAIKTILKIYKEMGGGA